MKEITHLEALRIIQIACSTWSDTLAEKWGKDIVLKRNIEISNELYISMRNACTKDQHKLFDEILGADHSFKVGEWVTFEVDRCVSDLNHCRTINWCENLTLPIHAIDGTNLIFLKKDLQHASTKNQKWHSLTGSNHKLLFRPATADEIKKATLISEGTPCFVRNYVSDGWKFRYADGNGGFYDNGRKTGQSSDWKYSMKLDINNLPVNPEI